MSAPASWHLLLDYDRPEHVPGFVEYSDSPASWWVGPPANLPDSGRAHAIIRARMERAGYRVVGWMFEPSAHGWHARVRLDPEPGSPLEIVALQAVCGSDPLREACNVQRARNVEHMDLRLLVRRLRAAIGAWEWVDPDEHAGAMILDKALAVNERLWGKPGHRDAPAFWRERWNVLYAPIGTEAPRAESGD